MWTGYIISLNLKTVIPVVMVWIISTTGAFQGIFLYLVIFIAAIPWNIEAVARISSVKKFLKNFAKVKDKTRLVMWYFLGTP